MFFILFSWYCYSRKKKKINCLSCHIGFQYQSKKPQQKRQNYTFKCKSNSVKRWFAYVIISEQHGTDFLRGHTAVLSVVDTGPQSPWKELRTYRRAILNWPIWRPEWAQSPSGIWSCLTIRPMPRSLPTPLLNTECVRNYIIKDLGELRKNKIIENFRHDEKGS